MTRAEVGQSVTHRRYVPYSHATTAARWSTARTCWACSATWRPSCIRTDGEEGLFAGYSSVAFEAPVRAGDVLEATAELVRVETRSREAEFTARVLCRAAPERSASAAEVLAEPVVVVRARGTVMVP